MPRKKERHIAFYIDDPVWDNIKIIQDYYLNEGKGEAKNNQIVRDLIYEKVKIISKKK